MCERLGIVDERVKMLSGMEGRKGCPLKLLSGYRGYPLKLMPGYETYQCLSNLTMF